MESPISSRFHSVSMFSFPILMETIIFFYNQRTNMTCFTIYAATQNVFLTLLSFWVLIGMQWWWQGGIYHLWLPSDATFMASCFDSGWVLTKILILWKDFPSLIIFINQKLPPEGPCLLCKQLRLPHSLLSRTLVSGHDQYILKLETVSFAKVVYNNFFYCHL